MKVIEKIIDTIVITAVVAVTLGSIIEQNQYIATLKDNWQDSMHIPSV